MNIPHKFDTCNITFALGCSLNCKYCPQEIFIKRYSALFQKNNYKFMKFDVFKNVLSKFEKTGCIVIGGFSEAFINPECSKMIQYAANEGYRLCLNTTLVGMTDKDLDLIKDIPFVENVLHIPDRDGNSKFRITPQYLSILKKFVESDIKIACYSCHGEVHPEIIPYLDPAIKVISTFNDRAGNVNSEEVVSVPVAKKGKLACLAGRVDGNNRGLVSFNPIILPNGYGVLCCSDWGLQHVLGDFASQSVEEIVSGKEFRYILRALDDDTLPLLCRKCSSAVERNIAEHGECTVNLLSGNAIKVGLYLDDYKHGKDLEFLSEETKNILSKIANAKKICIYGLGNLFHDNFFASHWNEVFCPDILCDGNSTLWNTSINNIPCISPEKLSSSIDKKDELLIITWVRNDSEIIKNLNNLGFYNIINAYTIFNMFD